MRFSILPLAAALAFSAQARADEPADGEIIPLDAERLFAPVGFDDNDEVTVMVDGYLPGSCRRLTKAEVMIDPLTYTVRIEPKARYFDIPCLEAMIPYQFEVRLGQLPVGIYDVTVAGPTKTIREKLIVRRALTSGPDDYLYAPVDAALVDLDHHTGKLYAILVGRFTKTCMVWDRVVVEDNGPTINILPIIKLDHPDQCDDVEMPFRKQVELPRISGGRKLLHVRSLNGQAVNYLFFKPRD